MSTLWIITIICSALCGGLGYAMTMSVIDKKLEKPLKNKAKIVLDN